MVAGSLHHEDHEQLGNVVLPLTGTSDTYQTANFAIYRTQDFRTFYGHMLAFDESNMNGSNQWRTTTNRYINNRIFTHCWCGSLYVDPADAPGPERRINLAFIACEGDDEIKEVSGFNVRIREADFLAWHAKQPLTDDGIRFGDVRAGMGWAPQLYYYNETNTTSGPPYRYDGGYLVGKKIPSSVNDTMLGPNCGQVYQQSNSGFGHRCVGAHTAIGMPDFIFFDPNRSNIDPWRRVMLYAWFAADNPTPLAWWGNHIAASPMLTHIQFNKDYDALPMAMCRNDFNTINGTDNGTTWGPDLLPLNGGVAEGVTAFYHPVANRYYVIYTRNEWTAPSYQIVYRMTEPGQPFSSLQLSWFMDETIQEHVLLRSHDYNKTFAQGGGANFGNPEVFTIKDGNGIDNFYIVFHCKLDYELNPSQFSWGRTPFFKELTLESQVTGKLLELKETDADKRRSVAAFRIPRCRQ